jgi:hypothetical protein
MESLDFLGGKICFYSNRQETIKSNFGGIISSICIILLGLLIAGFGQDFFKRTNPQIIQSTITSDEYPEFVVNNKNFSIAFRIEDDSGKLFDRTDLFYAEFIYYINQKNAKGTWEEIEYRILNSTVCNSNLIYDDSTFIQENDQIYCPILNNIIVGGYWDYNFVKAFQINVRECLEGNFSPNNIACATQEEKQKFLSEKLYFSLYYQEIIVNPHNYKQGLQRFMKTEYLILDHKLEKTQIYFFELNTMKTDYGWLLVDEKVENLIGFKDNSMDIISKDLLKHGMFEDSLARISIYFNKDLNEFRREYSKAQTLAAQVGGVLKFFIWIGSTIVSKYNLCMINLNLGSLILYEKNENEVINKETSKNDSSRFSLKNNFSSDVKFSPTILQLNIKNDLNSYVSPEIGCKKERVETPKNNLESNYEVRKYII